MSLSIKNAKLIQNGKEIVTNIYCEKGTIKSIGPFKEADDMIDAQENYVLPGLVDCHVHCRDPGQEYKEDFYTATCAAAAGGVTTILDMPNNKESITTLELLEQKRKIAAQKCVVNYGFYFGANDTNLEEIRKAKNIAGVKLFHGESTGNLIVRDPKVIEKLFATGILVAAHCEDKEVIEKNAQKYKGQTDPFIHTKIRAPEAAKKSLSFLLSLPRKSPLYVCHLSTVDELSLIEKFKKSGQSVFAEVCTHHLFLQDTDMNVLGNKGKMNPPLREKKHPQALWKAIGKGIVDTIATDHAPHTLEEKHKGYWDAPSGVPGLETLLPLLLTAVHQKKITLTDIATLCAKNPAKIFGMKKKGQIKVGYDADLTIIDMEKEWTIKNEKLQTKVGWSPYAGWTMKGAVETTIVGGEIAFDNGVVFDHHRGREVEFLR